MSLPQIMAVLRKKPKGVTWEGIIFYCTNLLNERVFDNQIKGIFGVMWPELYLDSIILDVLSVFLFCMSIALLLD